MNDTNETIRIGVVGAGANTRSRHIPGLQAIEGVEVVSVANRRLESAKKVAADFNIPTVYRSWQELVAAPDSDAIVIGTWPYLHCPVTLAALDAGKHVMCEARMAMDAYEARQMLAAAEKHKNLVTQVVPSPFTLGVDATIRRMIDNGEIGELLAVEIRSTKGAFLDPDTPMSWRQNRDLSGLNTLSLGIWYEALMRWIGEAERVTASGRVFTPERHDPITDAPKPVGVPEHLVVTADMACGALATFILSSVAGGPAANEATLYGSEATLTFRNGSLYEMRKGQTAPTPIDIPAEEAAAWRVEEEFVGAIRDNEVIRLTTFGDGVRYMVFTEAVALSLTERRTIEVPH